MRKQLCVREGVNQTGENDVCALLGHAWKHVCASYLSVFVHVSVRVCMHLRTVGLT